MVRAQRGKVACGVTDKKKKRDSPKAAALPPYRREMVGEVESAGPGLPLQGLRNQTGRTTALPPPH
jgi:hypothetical protein